MAVNTEYYRYFYYAAKYQNLTLAAAALESSQPNVTRVIRNLEAQLDCRLFYRSNRGISLTEEGERLYHHAAAAFEQLRQGEEALARGAGEGTVCIGASETALHALLLDVLRRFREAHPAVRLKIRNNSALGALEALRNGEIDFAVVTLPERPLPKPFRRTDLKMFRDILVGGERFRELADRPLRLRDLGCWPLISLTRDTAAFGIYHDFFLAHGLEFDPDMEVATADLLLPMVENGLGLSFLPEEFAGEALRTGGIVRLGLEEPIPERWICLVEDTRKSLGAAAGALREMLRAEKAENTFPSTEKYDMLFPERRELEKCLI